MTIKYRVFWICFIAGLLLGFGGYVMPQHVGVYVMIVGILLFVFSLSVLIFADRKSKKITEVLLDGLFWTLLPQHKRSRRITLA
jgi:uncharacterized protein YqgC (DUF456 family)